MDELRQILPYTAARAAALMRKGELSASQVAQSCLDRIAEMDPEIHAFAHIDAEFVLRQAKEADRRREAGEPLGALHGVPVAIKDVIDTSDLPTQQGSQIFAGNRPAQDAQCVRQLREAGAVILGKTVTTELASLTPGATLNPVARNRTPGGSSSGSAAAVAAHMCPIALGTQTAGSVLRPASYCGVYGFKPSFGLISRRGVLLQSHTLDTVGVLAASLDDIALATDAMAQYDAMDSASWPRESVQIHAALEMPGVAPLRLGALQTPAWDHAEPVMREAFAALCARLGARCETIELPQAFDAIIEQQSLIQFAENSYYYGELYDQHRERLSVGMRQRLEGGLKTNARNYLRAVNAREGHYALVKPLFETFDAIICPAAPGPAPEGLDATGSPIFNGFWTFLGMPALSMPVMQHEGLPMGLQIVGARGQDAKLLNVARRLETILAERVA